MISFIIPSGHTMRHFSGSEDVGSMFYAKTPVELLTYAASEFPHVFKEAIPDPNDGRKRLSFVSDNEIGLCNLVALSDLTPEETELITEEDRDGYMVKIVKTNRKFPTHEFQIILGEKNTIITMFPGPMAPPLPPKKGKSRISGTIMCSLKHACSVNDENHNDRIDYFSYLCNR